MWRFIRSNWLVINNGLLWGAIVWLSFGARDTRTKLEQYRQRQQIESRLERLEGAIMGSRIPGPR